MPFTGPQAERNHDAELRDACKKAIEKLTVKSAFFSERDLVRAVAEGAQALSCGIKAILSAVRSTLEHSKDIERLGKRFNEQIFTTKEMLRLEKELVSMAKEGVGKEKMRVTDETLSSVIKARPTIKEEQANALRHVTPLRSNLSRIRRRCSLEVRTRPLVSSVTGSFAAAGVKVATPLFVIVLITTRTMRVIRTLHQWSYTGRLPIILRKWSLLPKILFHAIPHEMRTCTKPFRIIALLLFFLVSLPAAAEFRDLVSVTNLRTSHFRPECSYRFRYLDRISDYHFYQVTNAYASYSIQQGGTSDKTRVFIEAPIPSYEMKQLVTAQKEPLRYTSAPDGIVDLRLIVVVAEGTPAVSYLSFSTPGTEDFAPLFLRPELFVLQRECVRPFVSR